MADTDTSLVTSSHSRCMLLELPNELLLLITEHVIQATLPDIKRTEFDNDDHYNACYNSLKRKCAAFLVMPLLHTCATFHHDRHYRLVSSAMAKLSAFMSSMYYDWANTADGDYNMPEYSDDSDVDDDASESMYAGVMADDICTYSCEIKKLFQQWKSIVWPADEEWPKSPKFHFSIGTPPPFSDPAASSAASPEAATAQLGVAVQGTAP